MYASTSVGQLVGNRLGQYYVEQFLGQGPINAVYLARNNMTSQVVMVTTFILPETFSSQAREHFMLRFKQEAAIVQKLNHPNILPVYDFGEQFGYPYMVTPLATQNSVAKLLKQQGRLSSKDVLNILKQVAAGLDYAHHQGAMHGSLKPINIIVDSENRVQIVGFGLTHILEMRGIIENGLPYTHLLNITGTFLGSPEYIAPETVRGLPIDAKADIYALGITLFELLSGKPPFTGQDPLQIARMHVLDPLPSLYALCPDLPAGIDMVLQLALERNPEQRITSAGQLIQAFERLLKVIDKAARPSHDSLLATRDTTLPPTVNWYDEELFARSDKLKSITAAQLNPEMIDTSGMPAVSSSASTSANADASLWAYTPGTPTGPNDEQTVDPFVWWSANAENMPTTATGLLTPGLATGRLQPPRPPVDKGRRKSVVLLATGGVVAAGILGVGGISLAHVLQKGNNTPASQPQASTNNVTQTVPSPTATHAVSATPTAKSTQQAKATPTATKSAPTPTPTPGHTGTVIGSTNMAPGSATNFTNPVNGQSSILIRLANGNFAAYSTVCPHEGAAVVLSGNVLRCTKHSSGTFSLSSGAVLSGPPPAPLPSVAVRVNGDGTITAG